MSRTDRHVVSLCQRGHPSNLRDTVASNIRSDDVHRVLAKQILDHAAFADVAAQADRRHILACELSQCSQVRERTRLVEPQHVKWLNGGTDHLRVARCEPIAAIEY